MHKHVAKLWEHEPPVMGCPLERQKFWHIFGSQRPHVHDLSSQRRPSAPRREQVSEQLWLSYSLHSHDFLLQKPPLNFLKVQIVLQISLLQFILSSRSSAVGHNSGAMQKLLEASRTSSSGQKQPLWFVVQFRRSKHVRSHELSLNTSCSKHDVELEANLAGAREKFMPTKLHYTMQTKWSGNYDLPITKMAKTALITSFDPITIYICTRWKSGIFLTIFWFTQ